MNFYSKLLKKLIDQFKCIRIFAYFTGVSFCQENSAKDRYGESDLMAHLNVSNDVIYDGSIKGDVMCTCSATALDYVDVLTISPNIVSSNPTCGKRIDVISNGALDVKSLTFDCTTVTSNKMQVALKPGEEILFNLRFSTEAITDQGSDSSILFLTPGKLFKV